MDPLERAIGLVRAAIVAITAALVVVGAIAFVASRWADAREPFQPIATAGGCDAALQLKAESYERIEEVLRTATVERPDLAARLVGVRDEGRGSIEGAADLDACEDADPATGIAIDLSALGESYDAVVQDATADLERLVQTAPEPKGRGKDDRGRGKDDDD